MVEWKPTKSFSIWKKLNPLWWIANEDDGWYGPDDYMSESNKLWRAICWFFRNPLHNFTFYVIGFCDRPSVSYGKAPEEVFIQGFNWAFTVVYGFLPLPFVSYQGSNLKWYAGWRSPGGAFGFKLRRI